MKNVLLVLSGVVGGSVVTMWFIKKNFDYIVSQVKEEKNKHNIMFDTKKDANKVLSGLKDILERYNVVSVADLHDLVGESGSYTDNKYGWTDLKEMKIVKKTNGYMLRMPEVITLN
jgi:hypothetical protein